MKKIKSYHWVFLLFLTLTACQGQTPSAQSKVVENPVQSKNNPISPITKADTLPTNNRPNNITRSIIEDKDGNIWFATFSGVFKYDGKSYSNISKEVSSARFFSILEDRKNNLWFGSIGAGVFYYDGKTFKNFTTNDGLINNEIVSIYEDKMGHIWFGAAGGVSRYDGNSFQNYKLINETIVEAKSGDSIPSFQRPINEVNAIIEDQTGNFWFATRGATFAYDGKTFTTVTHNDRPFSNVRWIIEDKKGAIWLGGNDGLWRYDGTSFKNITTNFTGYIYEDKEGNIWTSSDTDNGWALSRYDRTTLDQGKITAKEVIAEEGMLFGILEDSARDIWVGTLKGVYRCDKDTIAELEKIKALKNIFNLDLRDVE